MNTSFKIAKKIEELFLKNSILGATEISNILGISRTITHKALKDLLFQKKLKKIGKGAHTKYKSLIFCDSYVLNDVSSENIEYNPDYKTIKILEDYFYKYSAEGKLFTGFEGFKSWCYSRNMDVEEKIKNFTKVKTHIESLQNSCGLIDASEIFGKHFENTYLDNIFYADQYNWMEFGRGKLAEMTFFAKQSQNSVLIKQVNDEVFLKLQCIIKKNNFDAIAITPWSIDRKNQLLGFLKNTLQSLDLPFVNIIKFYENSIPIPQKSLKTRSQRIINAKNTIFVFDNNISQYKKVFLIDDFVGSGSTLNQTAKKLKDLGVEEIIGFSYVGNLNLDYEVINEV